MNRLHVFIIIYLVVATTCFASIFFMPTWYPITWFGMHACLVLIVVEIFQQQKQSQKEQAKRGLDAKLHG